MNVFFVNYSLETGQPTQHGSAPRQQLLGQNTPEIGIIISPTPLASPIEYQGMFIDAPDLALIGAALHRQVDESAGAARALFITDVPGQAQTYEKKEAEARAWTVGANPALFPFLATEASVRGVDIDIVAAEVMAQVNALIPLAALIEAHRIAAKNAVTAAPTVGAKAAAAVIDWAEVLTPAP